MIVHVDRATDARQMNALLNKPDVRPWVADLGDGVLDIGPLVANPANYLLMGEWGGVFFGCLGAGIYEAHTVVDPCARGRWGRGMLQAVAHWMFTRTDAYDITTRIPEGHTGALAAAVKTGMRPEFVIPAGTIFRGRICDVHVLSFRVQDWMATAPRLVECGRWFHERLASEAWRLGIQNTPHGDMESHNRYVGAAAMMMFGGQPVKAATIYNRWAMIHRHRTIELVSASCIKTDIGLIHFTNSGDIEVIREV